MSADDNVDDFLRDRPRCAEFLRKYPDRAEDAGKLFPDIWALHNKPLVIHKDEQSLTVMSRDAALKAVKRLESDAADLRKARDLLERWCSDDCLTYDFTEDENGDLAVWAGEDPRPLRKLLAQSWAVLNAFSARLLRHAGLLRKAWDVSRGGGALRKDAMYLDGVAWLLRDCPPREQRLWIEKLAPELLGHELPRSQQRERLRSRRGKRRARERKPVA